jgi:hypothetical protein
LETFTHFFFMEMIDIFTIIHPYFEVTQSVWKPPKRLALSDRLSLRSRQDLRSWGYVSAAFGGPIAIEKTCLKPLATSQSLGSLAYSLISILS